MSTWKPIDTAPDDGSDILIWQPNCNQMTVVHKDGSGFYDSSEEEVGPPGFAPITHWMRLPSPPKKGGF